MYADFFQFIPRRGIHPLQWKNASTKFCFPSEIEIVGDAQPGDQRQFLIDDGDAQLPRSSWVVNDRLPAVDAEGAGVGLMGPAQDLQESRLPCAVLSDEGMNLSSADVKGDVLQCLDAGEGLADVIQGKMGSDVSPRLAVPRLSRLRFRTRPATIASV
jgi:hypothetical protein